MANKHPWNRFWTLYGILLAVYLYLGSGLFWRQIVEHQHFSAKEKQQSYRRILIPACRGNIYDRQGRLLAGSRPRFSLVIYLSELQREFTREYRRRTGQLRQNKLPIDIGGEWSQARLAVIGHHLKPIEDYLHREIPIDQRAVDCHYSRQVLLGMPIVADLSPEDSVKMIEFLPSDGPLRVEVTTTRHYPHGPSAAHVIGYASPTVDFDSDDLMGKQFKTFSERGTVGRAGIEESMNETLRGVSGGTIWLVDPSGQKNRQIFSQDAAKGTDVTLSIDIDLQHIAEEAVGEEIGCAILSDVQTGEILAMANSPSFDLNGLTPYIPTKTYEAITARGAWINQCTQGLYPTGSVFKLVAAELLLRKGMVDRNTTHPCPGHTSVGNRTIRCSNHYERGSISFPLAVAKSCNSFFVDLILRVPLEEFIGEIRRFGFGEKTAIELPHESRHSLVPTPKWKRDHGYSRWTDGDTANLVMGQGYFLATPLQVNMFTASLASRRCRTVPSILRTDAKKNTAVPEEELGLSDGAYAALVEGMRGCVSYGSGRRCQLDGVGVAAKTGTAQIRHDGQNSHLAWFTAFAPADEGKMPRVAVTVMLRESFNGRDYGGGSDAAPVAKKILHGYFQKYGP
ncbi:MAG: hypothetical protein LBI69_03355 [Puniceicoccales bacterium]|jgi:penicillin-binding protein 2|nr:hypothetical protein [Puniceicoccales bacterium]